MQIKKGTILIKNSDQEYVLSNNMLNSKLLLYRDVADLLNVIFSKQGKLKATAKLLPGVNKIIRKLEKYHFITSEETESDYYISIDNYDIDRPLSSLSIELTDRCNLKCIHCYGSFGNNYPKSMLNFYNIRTILEKLVKLNCGSINLTGGECTIHKDFNRIAKLILEMGFNLGIMTNGYKKDYFIDFLNDVNEYNFIVKVSLDGTEEIHNQIRGDNSSYKNAIALIDDIYKRDNIKLYISSTLMKSNYRQFRELISFVEDRYPKCIHSLDLVLPCGNAILDSSVAFSIEELEKIVNDFPEIFIGERSIIRVNKPRCTGGVSQATLTSKGDLKICNCATDSRFYFRGNVLTDDLINIWNNPGINIEKYRNEKALKGQNCITCSKYSTCFATDCRVSAFLYTGNDELCSPITFYCSRNNDEDSI